MTNELIVKLAQEAGIIEGFNDVHPSIERFAALVEADFKTRLAQAIEDMPFGDTSASFAAFVRGFK